MAAANRPDNTRLNTLGAILYRAGRFEEAVRQLRRAVEVYGAEGTPYDALFLAMAHQQLRHADEARRWLRLGTAVDSRSVANHLVSGETPWFSRLELEVLRREATALIEPIHP
jgi:Flp pilus assembly protein TadD